MFMTEKMVNYNRWFKKFLGGEIYDKTWKIGKDLGFFSQLDFEFHVSVV